MFKIGGSAGRLCIGYRSRLWKVTAKRSRLMPMDKLPSGQVRYPSNSWGALARDPSLDVGIVGEALAETVRQNWLESGGTEVTFEETFWQLPTSPRKHPA